LKKQGKPFLACVDFFFARQSKHNVVDLTKNGKNKKPKNPKTCKPRQKAIRTSPKNPLPSTVDVSVSSPNGMIQLLDCKTKKKSVRTPPKKKQKKKKKKVGSFLSQFPLRMGTPLFLCDTPQSLIPYLMLQQPDNKCKFLK